uniref:ADP/ATP translocase n=1 Tax=Syphacia muris TaxID=451379 RepID=A0A0N5AKP1_9BILA
MGELEQNTALQFFKHFAAGATSAAVAKTVVAPIERVKLILQLQHAHEKIAMSKRYKGMIDCFIRVPKEQGFWSFWRGNMVNITRACSQESLGFAFKDFFKLWCLKDADVKDSYYKFFAGNLLAGGASGVCTYFIIYPLDFARTRLAIDMGRDTSREFTGFFNCLQKITRKSGFRGLYYGFLPSLQYIFLYRSAYFGLFDSVQALLPSNEKNQISFIAAFFLGQFVTFVAALVSYPHDTVRRRLMMQSGRKQIIYVNAVDCAIKIYKQEGFKGYYNGIMVNAVRGTGAALVLAIYNEIVKYI